ncbi:MAG TPA: SH3 domain-containing protein [Alphaproteobacteria bacterium]
MLVFFALVLAFITPVLAADKDDKKANKLPRFATLASPEVNIRTGPGTRYPIDWVIRRKGMPVEIVQQFEHWREIRTADDTKGWVHKVMLNSYRSMIVTGTEPQVMFAQPDLDARVMARIEPDVVGRLEACHKEWCQVKIQGYEGWMPKTAFWGVYPTEKFDE